MAKKKKERGERGRFSAKRKLDAVIRVIKGEPLDTLSREFGVTAATLSEWRDQFLAGAEANLKSRLTSPDETELLKLKAKVGELTMDLEAAEALLALRGDKDPFGRGRSSR